jgi:hypothetical protein
MNIAVGLISGGLGETGVFGDKPHTFNKSLIFSSLKVVSSAPSHEDEVRRGASTLLVIDTDCIYR